MDSVAEKDPAALSASGPRIAFMVHGLEQARAACSAAAETRRAISLLSPPGCAQYAGIGWFTAVIAQARATYPDVDMIAVLDCGDAAGRALQALSHGMRYLIIDRDCPALGRLRDIAGQRQATILVEAPSCVDLAAASNPMAACRAAIAAQDRG